MRMKAVVVTRYGEPEVMEFREMPVPVPGPREILVRVRGIGLNFADIFGRFGVYPGTPRPPFIPGLEFSGDVAAVGKEVTRFRGGERVMGYCRWGSHAEYVALKEDYATVMPEGMTYETGAAFLATSVSAWHGMVRLANTRRGENLLVHAAAGGVGLAAVQIGKHLGAEVFATAGSDEKVRLARENGADHVINYTRDDFAAEVERITGGYGVDVVMDSVGGEVYRKSWNLLAQMGRYVLYGVSAVTGPGSLSKVKALAVYAQMKPIFVPGLMSANKGLFGFNLGTLRGKEAYFREATDAVLALFGAKVLRPLVGRIFPFEKIVEAHHVLQTRQSMGKVVVTVG